jgi:Zn-dependent peptidase ImmA (M78 family)
VERHRDIYASLQEGLQDDECVTFGPPKFPTRSVKRAAEIVRAWLNLEDHNTFPTYRHAVESRGLLVFRSNGYAGPWQIPKDDPICGFTVYDANCPVIVVKKMPFESRQTFTLMHELGHVLLHRQSFIDDEDDLHAHAGKERTANAFAGCLLVPDKFLRLVDDSYRPSGVSAYDDWLRPFRKSWGVSSEVILRRLLDSGRLDDVSYNSYRDWRQKQPSRQKSSGSRQWRHREPRRVFGDPFVTTVLDALHARQISLSKASTYLDNLKVSDVHKLEESYAGI